MVIFFKKIQFSKSIIFYLNNENHNWLKKQKNNVVIKGWYWKEWQLLQKKPRKKIKIKTITTKLENIILSIWIERWNWKSLKLL